MFPRGDRESMMAAASGADQEMTVQLIHSEGKADLHVPDSPSIPWTNPEDTPLSQAYSKDFTRRINKIQIYIYWNDWVLVN